MRFLFQNAKEKSLKEKLQLVKSQPNRDNFSAFEDTIMGLNFIFVFPYRIMQCFGIAFK